MSPNSSHSLKLPWIWSMKYRHLGGLGFRVFNCALEKTPHSSFSGTATTLSYSKCICHNPAEIPGGLALRGRALDMYLSFNQLGHTGRAAFLVVFLYFFVWPQVKHRITMEHFCKGKKKRSMEFPLHLQRSVAWANFYSGAHLIHVSSPSLWLCTGRLVANICFDNTRFPRDHSGLVQQQKCALLTSS